MTDILVTKAAVRKLAASLSKIDSSSLRHTDRLDVIADAFGWRTDAFMHALKGNSTAGGKARVAPSTLLAGATLDQLGIRLLDSWMRAISSPSGLCLACGATGSGRTTTLAASARHLEASGRRVYTQDNFPTASHGDGDVVLFGDLRDRTTAERAFGYADSGYLVLAVSPLFTVERTVEVLSGYGMDETRFGVIRGAISQHLVRLVCRSCGTAGCDVCSHRGYKGRTLASHVVRFHGPDDVSEYLRAGDGVWHGLAGDVARKLADGQIDIKEIDRKEGCSGCCPTATIFSPRISWRA
ncbi:hypothetical protein OIU34_23055 [Pararhizobium sp. BT-229]|uniref:ATPase, T2SS/T4P/T4SS family n=1 Tax=Pararhizobium sp. BT-229 TaxID=2986923 RepID=UPI0021F750C3|nr:hypothetical protein [Pararhizobium sp. BT-229]MCV9964774.1 hypothetical protein [Pararhizobium sp. BT-229]